jgi:hypothetical protein
MAHNELLTKPLAVVNVGVSHFASSMSAQGAETVQVEWRPPVDGKLSFLLKRTAGTDFAKKVDEANAKVLEALLAGNPFWVGMRSAGEAIPGMKKNMVLHSGPPISWERMCDVQKNGILGGLLHEKMANDYEEALDLVKAGKVEIRPANDMGAIGAGVGITTYSMPVNICEDRATGQEAYCIPFEGRSGLGAWGVYNPEVEANLKMLEDVFMPAVDGVLRSNGGISVKNIITQGLQMGDENHTRQTAEGLLLVAEIVPMLLDSDLDKETTSMCVKTFLSSERWVHPLGMAGSFAVIKSAKGVEYSSVVTAITSNGVDTGIKVCALGERWFITEAPQMVGQFLSSKWGPDDVLPYLGGSTVTEVYGLGAFSAAAAPVVLRLRGGGWREAKAQSEEMMAITVGTNHNYPIPLLDFNGPPIGIDIRKVVETGITPICHGGIISKKGGQAGAGAARFPMKIYTDALWAFFEKYGIN